MNETCNGYTDCDDKSDEDPRKGKINSWVQYYVSFSSGSKQTGCNDICENHGCYSNCTTSPVGPICLCPIGQQLADDLVNCTSKSDTPKQVITETAAPVGAFAPVFGTLAAVLALICLIVTWKYFQAKVFCRNIAILMEASRMI